MGRRLRIGDLLSDGTFREVCSLAIRGVVKEWHCGLPCLSFGTLRTPQVRSIEFPFGFDCKDPFTAMHNKLAIRAAIILILAITGGQYISVEQPGSSRLYLLDLYKVLISLGCVISKFAFCAHGSGFNKRSKWLHNKPWLLPLESKCTCASSSCHFRSEGTFTKKSIEQFAQLCRPNCEAVYGCLPKAGQRVSSFSAAYPRSLMQSMAVGAVAARSSATIPIPLSKRIESFKLVGLDPANSVSWPVEEASFPDRPWHQDPEWISELCESLPFKELFRYQFARSGHINVNEARTYKTWLKSMAKSHPDTRFVGILDSRVTLGAAAKGRSSSFAISRVLQGALRYVIGGGLYPGVCIVILTITELMSHPATSLFVVPPRRYQSGLQSLERVVRICLMLWLHRQGLRSWLPAGLDFYCFWVVTLKDIQDPNTNPGARLICELGLKLILLRPWIVV